MSSFSSDFQTLIEYYFSLYFLYELLTSLTNRLIICACNYRDDVDSSVVCLSLGNINLGNGGHVSHMPYVQIIIALS